MYVELQDFESNRRPYLDGLARSAGFRPFQELSAQTDISGVCLRMKSIVRNVSLSKGSNLKKYISKYGIAKIG